MENTKVEHLGENALFRREELRARTLSKWWDPRLAWQYGLSQKTLASRPQNWPYFAPEILHFILK